MTSNGINPAAKVVGDIVILGLCTIMGAVIGFVVGNVVIWMDRR